MRAVQHHGGDPSFGGGQPVASADGSESASTVHGRTCSALWSDDRFHPSVGAGTDIPPIDATVFRYEELNDEPADDQHAIARSSPGGRPRDGHRDSTLLVDPRRALVAGRAAARPALEVDDALVGFASPLAPRRSAADPQRADRRSCPPTPGTPTTPAAKDLASELTLLTVARRLGQPVGYLPEHGGRIVQNIVPTRADADRQVSTSSRSKLMFHTETAFHPHRPRYLLLLCLRGDPAAHTTLASVHDVLTSLA